ncbi:Protein AF-9 [Smittium culicis]|uniref:Protein AF-9 homolog n=1 Tax=Smittium culicis TaxID=133412 RepID=A0A1R1X587_9FUNG|nr:Protein AF-9 [Smittium culicis]
MGVDSDTILTFIVKTTKKPTPNHEIDSDSGFNLYNWSVSLLEGRPGFDNNSRVLPYVKQVEFHLHDTFPSPVRFIKRPPYVVSEKGWGEFELVIVIHFNDFDLEPMEITHDLCFSKGPEYIEKYSKNIGIVSEEFEALLNRRPNISSKTIPSKRPTVSRKGLPKSSAMSTENKTPSYSSNSSDASDLSDYYSSSSNSDGNYKRKSHRPSNPSKSTTSSSIIPKRKHSSSPHPRSLDFNNKFSESDLENRRTNQNHNNISKKHNYKNLKQETNNSKLIPNRSNKKPTIGSSDSSRNTTGNNSPAHNKLVENPINEDNYRHDYSSENSFKRTKTSSPIPLPKKAGTSTSRKTKASLISKLKSKTARESISKSFPGSSNSHKIPQNSSKLSSNYDSKQLADKSKESIIPLTDSNSSRHKLIPNNKSPLSNDISSSSISFSSKIQRNNSSDTSHNPEYINNISKSYNKNENIKPTSSKKIIVEGLGSKPTRSKIIKDSSVSPPISKNSQMQISNKKSFSSDSNEPKGIKSKFSAAADYKKSTSKMSSRDRLTSELSKPKKSTGLYTKKPPLSSSLNADHAKKSPLADVLSSKPLPKSLKSSSELQKAEKSTINKTTISSNDKSRTPLPDSLSNEFPKKIDSNSKITDPIAPTTALSENRSFKRARVRGSGRFSAGTFRSSNPYSEQNYSINSKYDTYDYNDKKHSKPRYSSPTNSSSSLSSYYSSAADSTSGFSSSAGSEHSSTPKQLLDYTFDKSYPAEKIENNNSYKHPIDENIRKSNIKSDFTASSKANARKKEIVKQKLSFDEISPASKNIDLDKDEAIKKPSIVTAEPIKSDISNTMAYQNIDPFDKKLSENSSITKSTHLYNPKTDDNAKTSSHSIKTFNDNSQSRKANVPINRLELLESLYKYMENLDESETEKIIQILHEYSIKSIISNISLDLNSFDNSDIESEKSRIQNKLVEEAIDNVNNHGYYECDLEQLSDDALSSVYSYLNKGLYV